MRQPKRGHFSGAAGGVMGVRGCFVEYCDILSQQQRTGRACDKCEKVHGEPKCNLEPTSIPPCADIPHADAAVLGPGD